MTANNPIVGSLFDDDALGVAKVEPHTEPAILKGTPDETAKNWAKCMPDAIAVLRQRHKHFHEVYDNVTDRPKLSWRAKGLLAFILSRRIGDDAQRPYYLAGPVRTLYPRDILFHGIDGRQTVASGLRELHNAGYGAIHHVYNEQGKLQEMRFAMVDEPDYDKVGRYHTTRLGAKPAVNPNEVRLLELPTGVRVNFVYGGVGEDPLPFCQQTEYLIAYEAREKAKEAKSN